jgi:hypothetical protein
LASRCESRSPPLRVGRYSRCASGVGGRRRVGRRVCSWLASRCELRSPLPCRSAWRCVVRPVGARRVGRGFVEVPWRRAVRLWSVAVSVGGVCVEVASRRRGRASGVSVGASRCVSPCRGSRSARRSAWRCVGGQSGSRSAWGVGRGRGLCRRVGWGRRASACRSASRCVSRRSGSRSASGCRSGSRSASRVVGVAVCVGVAVDAACRRRWASRSPCWWASRLRDVASACWTAAVCVACCLRRLPSGVGRRCCLRGCSCLCGSRGRSIGRRR